jgi:hypothetical protein
MCLTVLLFLLRLQLQLQILHHTNMCHISYCILQILHHTNIAEFLKLVFPGHLRCEERRRRAKAMAAAATCLRNNDMIKWRGVLRISSRRVYVCWGYL